MNKYQREIKPGVFVDVYDVLKAWSVSNPALQHLLKKALQPGERGHKDLAADLKDIISSAQRAYELEFPEIEDSILCVPQHVDSKAQPEEIKKNPQVSTGWCECITSTGDEFYSGSNYFYNDFKSIIGIQEVITLQIRNVDAHRTLSNDTADYYEYVGKNGDYYLFMVKGEKR